MSVRGSMTQDASVGGHGVQKAIYHICSYLPAPSAPFRSPQIKKNLR
jgi:hypothetical protein